MVGGSLTSQEGFPLLLTRKNSVSKEVIDEIKRLKPEEIFIFGGEAAVSLAVEKEIKETGVKIRRLAGDDRYKTAGAIAVARLQLIIPNASGIGDEGAAINAFNFVDALSA